MTYTWTGIAELLLAQPVGSHVRLPRDAVSHPRDERLSRGLGVPVGQTADFFLPLSDGRGLHVQEFGAHYEAHLDSTQVGCDKLLRTFGPAEALTTVVGMTAIGGLLGLLLGRTKESTVIGALLGAAIGGATAVAVDAGAGAPSPSEAPSTTTPTGRR